MASGFKIDTKEIDKFMKKFKKAASKEFQEKLSLWLEAMGFEFLDIIQEIGRAHV